MCTGARPVTGWARPLGRVHSQSAITTLRHTTAMPAMLPARFASTIDSAVPMPVPNSTVDEPGAAQQRQHVPATKPLAPSSRMRIAPQRALPAMARVTVAAASRTSGP